MNNYVLDSSAILAVLNQERGSEKAIDYFANGVVNAVNLSETLAKLIERGHSVSTAQEAFDLLQLPVVSFDAELAQKTAELRPLTRHLGLSLGDRSCLALGILRDATVVTADRDWKRLKLCLIEIIR